MDALQSMATPHAPETAFAVAYQEFFGVTYNPDLRGKGTFTVAAGGTQYRFTGRKRGLFGGKTELQFAPADIRNVRVDGQRVEFSRGIGAAGRTAKPFVFYCKDAETAHTAARLLPGTVDEAGAAHADFRAKLAALAPSAHPFASITNILIAINVVVFVVFAGFLNAGWLEVTDLTAYMRWGANNGAATTDGEWWRLVTSAFLHFGAIHLLLNMWALFQTGHLVERLQGRRCFLATYLGSAIGGGVVSLLFHGDQKWSAGASGAVFGVYGALLGYMLRQRQALPRAVYQPLVKSTLTFAGYNLFYGMIHPAIDNAAHVGGFAAGVTLGWLTAMPLDAAVRSQRGTGKLATAVGMIALIVAIAVLAAPRFDYSMREELAWRDAVLPFVTNEPTMVQKQNAAVAQWERAADNGPELTRLVDRELEPFYREFGEKIHALTLVPGRRTAARRDALAQFAALRLQGYQHLRGAVNHDPAAFDAYRRCEADAGAIVKALQASQKPAR